ncbi:MAG: PilZ domain-containing protein [Desulfobacterales bacterium]|jgi:hypothetical protein
MSKKKAFVEHRKHKRFKVKSGAVAIEFNTAFEYIHIGQIMDISKSGLAFSYIDIDGELAAPFELDIVAALDGFYLKNVPFKTVWGSPVAGHSAFIFLERKQRGVQFGEMTPHQISRLDYFLHNYTVR